MRSVHYRSESFAQSIETSKSFPIHFRSQLTLTKCQTRKPRHHSNSCYSMNEMEFPDILGTLISITLNVLGEILCRKHFCPFQLHDQGVKRMDHLHGFDTIKVLTTLSFLFLYFLIQIKIEVLIMSTGNLKILFKIFLLHCHNVFFFKFQVSHINKLYKNSKCVEVYGGFSTSVEQSLLVAIKFQAMSQI